MGVRSRLAKQNQRRQYRVRNRVVRDAHGRPRLSVFRSNRHMYAQIIDDAAGKTLVAASTVEAEIAGPGGVGSDAEAAGKGWQADCGTSRKTRNLSEWFLIAVFSLSRSSCGFGRCGS